MSSPSLSTGTPILSRRALAAVLAVMVTTAAVRADQAPDPQAGDQQKAQAFLYEMALRAAVSAGGQRLAQEALSAFPGIQLTTEEPIVRGVRLPDYGYHFDVQAPNIQSTILVWDMLRSTRPPTRQVADGRTAATGGLVEPDPMAGDEAAAPFDPDAAYSAYVREALIDAMLDSSAVLPFHEGDRLTVTASGIDEPGTQLIRSRKLILTIKAEDLQSLRQGRITRDEAKQRIVEERF